MADVETWNFRCAAPLARGGRTLVMGIVNLTPDSFSDGGKPPASPAEAAETALAMLADGADVIDFGAESSRPGAGTISPEEEIARLGDVVARVRAHTDKPISVDTYHPETARHVLGQGADIINDITALRGGWSAGDAAAAAPMAALAARERAHVVLMHMPAPPRAMQEAPQYADVVGETLAFLLARAAEAEAAGISRDAIWLDPGFGFGKTFSHNREILLRLAAFVETGYPVLVGMSRKRMIADGAGLPAGARMEASVALSVIAAMKGAAMTRVHDVSSTARAMAMTRAILHGVEPTVAAARKS